ncbi:type I restriction enzyme M protein [Nitrosomonas oligotropha]|uniref:site-specific DNA-methyltransferase (adenine-specific) n=1 Tax=Nitrosomonas oligotropha TaxID=42354 RepID=A0A2T5HF98_9PROT|nr:N-6 DNA methylase [Nitrosomonas oligotropha]PTQ70250.1 type I restriction enzyme M protein [Nitrosomonas oligotropha]
MAQLENIEAIEKRLWGSADNLRANSNYASNEYFMPVMGLIFLRHAYSRYLAVKPQIEAALPSRGGVTRPLTKEDFSSKGAIFLREKAQFDSLVNLTDADDRAQAVIDAMEAIEADYETLKGILPKSEYQELDNDVLGNLLRTFNDPALKKATGDIFGRIYEYFLTQFANQSAHDGGEFFTPVSLVQMIVNFIEPDHGSVIDPACGSGGMFVQSAHFIEKMHKNPQDVATFYGAEKNPTTIRLAKMNLAVHGLEGKIQKAISYYEDPHDFLGKADFVMANPPFNVDDVDAEKIKNDPRLPFGLPGVNKKGAVSNGNYLWISYFYSYLNKEGRAGFVMSSQASSAGGQEAEVRRKLVESGHVEGMIAIRSNFFYTRTVPCELWFLNKNKPAGMKDKVLMLDARNVYTKVTRKIYDFSPEQLANLTSIVWLYRGQKDRFLSLVESYLTRTLEDAKAAKPSMDAFIASFDKLASKLEQVEEETSKAFELLASDIKAFENAIEAENKDWEKAPRDNAGLLNASQKLEPMAETSRDLIKQIDQLYKLIEKQAKQSTEKGLNKLIKEFDDERKEVVEQLKQVRYIFKQAHWLQERFPDAALRDVEGLVKLVDIAEIKANDWSLTPGRYVGVAPEIEDEDFDFEETLRDIHIELKGLNEEAALLAAQIQKNFEELGI